MAQKSSQASNSTHCIYMKWRKKKEWEMGILCYELDHSEVWFPLEEMHWSIAIPGKNILLGILKLINWWSPRITSKSTLAHQLWPVNRTSLEHGMRKALRFSGRWLSSLLVMHATDMVQRCNVHASEYHSCCRSLADNLVHRQRLLDLDDLNNEIIR